MERKITTEVVRDAVTYPRKRLGEPRDMTAEQFDRWLAEVVREASEKVGSERDAAWSTIAKVRELHYEYDHECAECSFEPMPEVDFRGVSVPWPCRTIQALGSVPSTGKGNE